MSNYRAQKAAPAPKRKAAPSPPASSHEAPPPLPEHPRGVDPLTEQLPREAAAHFRDPRNWLGDFVAVWERTLEAFTCTLMAAAWNSMCALPLLAVSAANDPNDPKPIPERAPFTKSPPQPQREVPPATAGRTAKLIQRPHASCSHAVHNGRLVDEVLGQEKMPYYLERSGDSFSGPPSRL